MIKRILAGWAALSLLLSLAACAGSPDTDVSSADPASSQTASLQTESAPASEDPEGPQTITAPVSQDNVRYLGRWLDDSATGRTWFDWSCSGFEFEFTGTELRVTLGTQEKYVGNDYQRTNVVVYLDGAEEPAFRFPLAQASGEYTLVKDAPEGTHTVRVMKASEMYHSAAFYAENLVVTGQNPTIAPTAAKQRRIEFIGDSITASYGVLATRVEALYYSWEQDASRGFAYKTAQNFNADASIIAISGNGVYCDLQGNTENVMPDYYPCADLWYDQDTGKAAPTEWDFSVFQPDLVVLHLGNNDSPPLLTPPNLNDRAGNIQLFLKAYVDFLKTIRAKNPNAYILGATGGVPCGLAEQAAEAIEAYKAETGDTRISYFQYTTNMYNVENGVRSGHPSEEVHDMMAQELTAEITRLLGWK